MRIDSEITLREKIIWTFVLFCVIFTGTWTGIHFYTLIEAEQEDRTVYLYEGAPGWFSVNAIEHENILLKKKLDDMQVHYDSMVCYRPQKRDLR